MTFKYNVRNICGTVVHSSVIVSEESIEVWQTIASVKQNLAPEGGKWNNADWSRIYKRWQLLALLHHLNPPTYPLSLTPVWQDMKSSSHNQKDQLG